MFHESTTLLPAPMVGSEVELQISDLAERRMLAPSREAGYELSLIGTSVLPRNQVITKTEQGTWLLVDQVEDPTAKQYGGKIPVPDEQHSRLKSLDQAGVSPDLIWLAHELPDQWQEGTAIPSLVPSPRHLREKDQRLSQNLRFATELFLKGAGATLGMAAAAPFVVAGAVVSVAAGLDPVVLGGVRHPEAPIVQWAILAQWTWE